MRRRCWSSYVLGPPNLLIWRYVQVDYVSRLVLAGIRPDCAVETVAWFRSQSEERKLEEYTKECEERAGIA